MTTSFDPLYKVHNAYRLGQIPQEVYDLIMKRFPLVIDGIKRVEEASGLNYPYYYAEPSLVISVSAVEFTQMGILFARTIPVVDAHKQLHVVVQITAPLICYGLKGTIHAILAHEFMHYLELINRILKMKVISDDVSSTLFERCEAGGEGHQNVDEQRPPDFKDTIRCQCYKNPNRGYGVSEGRAGRQRQNY
jgi:hypothetical protein